LIKNTASKITGLINKIYKHIESRISYARISILERMAVSGGVLISGGLVLLFCLFFLAFGSIAAGFWLGREFDDMVLGFGIVGGFWFVLSILGVLFRESLLELPIRDLIVKLMMDDEDEDEIEKLESEEVTDQNKTDGED
jgi:hypothetical protein